MATEPLYGVTVKDVDQTLDYILAHHSSVARFGDGEIDLIAGRNIPYQSYDPALAEHLKRVLYTPSRPELVVCMSGAWSATPQLPKPFGRKTARPMRPSTN